MIRRGRGKIINIASVQTALARPGIAPYTATRGAVANLTKGMATDWARYGLQCNAIAPGYFDTPLNAALVADPEFTKWLVARTPTGRWGQVAELAGAAVFLASDASSFVVSVRGGGGNSRRAGGGGRGGHRGVGRRWSLATSPTIERSPR